MSAANRYLRVGDDLLTLPKAEHASVGIHTKSRSAFVGTLEEWAALDGYTFAPMASGTSAYVVVKDAEGNIVATVYCSDGFVFPQADPTARTLAEVQAILAEVQS